MGVGVVVAPQADSQLAYLCKTGVCQAVMTEDSDVIVYSVACEKPFTILFKFDKKNNTVQTLDCATLFDMQGEERGEEQKMELMEEGEERETPPVEESSSEERGKGKDEGKKGKRKKKDKEEKEKTLKAKGFLPLMMLHFQGRRGIRMFAQMCILAGCDYAEPAGSWADDGDAGCSKIQTLPRCEGH